VEQSNSEMERQRAVQWQKDDEWNRQVTELFSKGSYSDAGSILNLWMGEFPGSARALEYRSRMEEIRRGLKACTLAMAESRYQDALNVLEGVEKINPTDPGLSELRKQIDAGIAAARATLTVNRLGAKANILLDGRPIGSEGEIANEKIGIGYHTLVIENDAGIVASRSQEFFEGQGVALVYDVAGRYVRPMSEADRGLLSQRRAMEEVHSFSMDHDHGVLRGSCRGELRVSFYEVIYKPSSGSHGFRLPFKILHLRVDGKIASLLYASDNKNFQSFKFPDEQAALMLKKTWDELKSLSR
jgi:hypothetical protein